MSLARLVITAVTLEGRSKSAVARDYGLSRRWVQQLCLRYQLEGEAAFEARSRRPHAVPRRSPPALEDEIVEIRKYLAEEGLDAGPSTIAYHLSERHGASPSLSTIWRVLSRRGFVVPEPHKRPRSSIQRFVAAQPNERWQADITHVRLADGYEVEILNQLDDHSRLLVGSSARNTFSAYDVLNCFERAAACYGTPASYLTDNAAVFTGHYRGKGWVALESELVARGVRLCHSRPYHPQTCGKVERFHQTLKRWLEHQDRARTVRELQMKLDVFRDYYNEFRPHRALGRATPKSVYEARPKAVPIPPPTPIAHSRIRYDVVDKGGTVTLRYASRLFHIGIGRGFANRRVILLVQDLDVRVLAEDGELIRALTLDPTKNYQRLS